MRDRDRHLAAAAGRLAARGLAAARLVMAVAMVLAALGLAAGRLANRFANRLAAIRLAAVVMTMAMVLLATTGLAARRGRSGTARGLSSGGARSFDRGGTGRRGSAGGLNRCTRSFTRRGGTTAASAGVVVATEQVGVGAGGSNREQARNKQGRQQITELHGVDS